MRNSARTLLYIGFAWLFNALLSFAILPSRIEKDLEAQSNQLLIDNGYSEWQTKYTGLDAILLGPDLPRGVDKHPEEDGIKLALTSKIKGLHSIVAVRYGASNEALTNTSSKREYFIISRLEDKITIRGDFENVNERADVSQVLRDMFGSTSVRELGTVNSDLRPLVDADQTIRKMGWMKVLTEFIFDFDGHRVELSGEAPSTEKARAIGEHIRLIFGKKVPVINRLTANGKPVETPPNLPGSKVKRQVQPTRKPLVSARKMNAPPTTKTPVAGKNQSKVKPKVF